MSNYGLRSYQADLIARARGRMLAGVKRLILKSPTGSGKTVLTANMLETSASKGMHSLFCVHRRELVLQSTRTFSNVGVRHGIIAAGFPGDREPFVQIGSIGTLANRLGRIARPSLFIWDECHHIAAATWGRIHAAFPDAFHIGLTATPGRLDGRGLGDYFDEMLDGPEVAWLIENKYLSPYKLFAPATVDTRGIGKGANGDFKISDINGIVNRPVIVGNLVTEWQRRAYDYQTVVFAGSIEHSNNIVAQFRAAGVMAVHVDGETPSEERDRAIKDFEAGRIRVLSNVDLFGEGFDVPAIQCVIDAAPTNSLTKWLQRCGRALRYIEGKVAIILDHGGNCMRHGLPDEPRKWNLQGRAVTKSTDKAGPSVKICPKCFAAQTSFNRSCFLCGHVFLITARKIEEVEGDLVEVMNGRVRMIKGFQTHQAKELDDLIALGKTRGYKGPEAWAAHILAGRAAKAKAKKEGKV